MHLGHMVPFVFSKYAVSKILNYFLHIFPPRWLQDVFEVPIVVQLTGFSFPSFI